MDDFLLEGLKNKGLCWCDTCALGCGKWVLVDGDTFTALFLIFWDGVGIFLLEIPTFEFLAVS